MLVYVLQAMPKSVYSLTKPKKKMENILTMGEGKVLKYSVFAGREYLERTDASWEGTHNLQYHRCVR